MTGEKHTLVLDHPDPFFHLLFMGGDTEIGTRVVEEARSWGNVEKAALTSSISHGFKIWQEQEFRIGKSHGCQLMVLHQDSLEYQNITDLVKALGEYDWKGFHAFFVLSNEYYSFSDHVNFISKNVMFCGDLPQFSDLLNRLISIDEAVCFPSLVVPFQKKPSEWIRQFKHDYFGGFYAANNTSIVEHGLLGVQREIDFLQDVLRNVLVFHRNNSHARFLKPSDETLESDICRQALDTEAFLVCPVSLAGSLPSYWQEGMDYYIYENIDQARELLTQNCEEDQVGILACTEIFDYESVFAGTAQMPVWVVIGDHEEKQTLQGWQQLCDRNLAGAFSLKALMEEEGCPHLFAIKRSYWKVLALRTLPQIFDRIIQLLVQTWNQLEPELSENYKRRIFFSYASICNARALYLSNTTKGDHHV